MRAVIGLARKVVDSLGIFSDANTFEALPVVAIVFICYALQRHAAQDYQLFEDVLGLLPNGVRYSRLW
jgi:hypothetical protein